MFYHYEVIDLVGINGIILVKQAKFALSSDPINILIDAGQQEF